MKALQRRLLSGLRNTYVRLWASETLVMLTMAVLVGTGGGFGAVAFRWRA